MKDGSVPDADTVVYTAKEHLKSGDVDGAQASWGGVRFSDVLQRSAEVPGYCNASSAVAARTA